MYKAVFTGGGSAGHVSPNIALFGKLRDKGWSIEYIGSEAGIERSMIEPLGYVPYHPIASGKLRRYFDLNNFKDPLRVIKGAYQSYRLLRRLKPDVVFSKGGFVSVPVIIGSKLNRIPVVIHESDMSPGLANRISIPLADKVCATFPETLAHLPKNKAVVTGTPIRPELLQGNAERGRKLCGFHSRRPIVIVMGGSLGARAINQSLREALPELLTRYQIIHICGKGNVDDRLAETTGYCQYEFVSEELADLLASADLAISRAGANAIFEFLAAKKPMLLIPLTRQASRGDQLLNAASFEKSGYATVLYEERLSTESLVEELDKLRAESSEIAERMAAVTAGDSADLIANLIEQTAVRHRVHA